jgi:hypothetical protein
MDGPSGKVFAHDVDAWNALEDNSLVANLASNLLVFYKF